MFDLHKIDAEIASVMEAIITSDDDLNLFRDRYLSKNGILPDIYRSIEKTKGQVSNFYLTKMIELRRCVDEKIKSYQLFNN